LSGRTIPQELPAVALELLKGLECDLIDEDEVPECWLTKLADEPNIGAVRPAVERLPGLVLH
jgi:hypothetical protein